MTDDVNATKIVIQLLQLGTDLLKTGNRIAAEYMLNQQQFIILNEIVRKGTLNQRQLIGELLYEKSNVSKIVKKLKNLNYINVNISHEDGRITLLSPTKEGESVWRQCMEKLNKWNRNWVKSLSGDEINETLMVLNRLKGL